MWQIFFGNNTSDVAGHSWYQYRCLALRTHAAAVERPRTMSPPVWAPWTHGIEPVIRKEKTRGLLDRFPFQGRCASSGPNITFFPFWMITSFCVGVFASLCKHKFVPNWSSMHIKPACGVSLKSERDTTEKGTHLLKPGSTTSQVWFSHPICRDNCKERRSATAP